MSENFDEITSGPITVERAKHHCGQIVLVCDCDWRVNEIEQHIDSQSKLLFDFGRHLLNIQQDICENAFVEASIYDAVKQALSEVAPEHPALRNEPPNFGVWEHQRKQITELQNKNEQLKQALEAMALYISVAERVPRTCGAEAVARGMTYSGKRLEELAEASETFAADANDVAMAYVNAATLHLRERKSHE
jgi:hypothetical protein